MAGKIYTVSFTAIAVTGITDIFEITPADDKPLEVLGFFWGQHSDFGDAQAEQIPYRVIRGFTSSGTGGTSTTPRPLSGSANTAFFTAETNNTTVATTGTTHDLHSDVINIQAGEKLWLPEGCEWCAAQGDTSLVVRLAVAPADSITCDATLYVREIGG